MDRSWREIAAGRQLLDSSTVDLSRASRGLRAEAERTVRAWHEAVLELVRTEGNDRRDTARFLAYGVNGLTVALMIVVFASTGGVTGAEVGIAGGSAVLGQRLLEAVFGDQAVRRLAQAARADLNRRLEELLAVEARRFEELLDALDISADAVEKLRLGARRIDDIRFSAH